MSNTQQIIQLLEAAPVATASPDALTCYREGLRISADHWYKAGRTAHADTRIAVYSALANVCGPNGARLVNVVVKAMFGADGFNQLAGCEILALYHWVRPFKAGDHWATAAQAVYECVGRVRSMVKTIRVEAGR